jgi:ectoine hydroxylase
MASVQIALDRSTRGNGCLQVLKGSHLLGRIDHKELPGGQIGADLQRVEWALRDHEVVHAEMEPGDGIFFHCNLLHCSAQNRSPDRRWTVICCYNTKTNSPLLEHHHPPYTPLHKVDDGAVLRTGIKLSESTGQFNQRAVNPRELL